MAVAAGLILMLLAGNRLPKDADFEAKKRAQAVRNRTVLGAIACALIAAVVFLFPVIFPRTSDSSVSPDLNPTPAINSSLPATETPEVVPSVETPSPPVTTTSPVVDTTTPTPPTSSRSVEYLAEKEPVNLTTTWHEVDQLYHVGGEPLDHSIRLRCERRCFEEREVIEFDLGRDYSTLRAIIGINDRAKNSDQPARVTIYLDGKNVKELNFSPEEGKYQPLELPLNQAGRIKFEIMYNGPDPERDKNMGLDIVIGGPTLHR